MQKVFCLHLAFVALVFGYDLNVFIYAVFQIVHFSIGVLFQLSFFAFFVLKSPGKHSS